MWTKSDVANIAGGLNTQSSIHPPADAATPAASSSTTVAGASSEAASPSHQPDEAERIAERIGHDQLCRAESSGYGCDCHMDEMRSDMALTIRAYAAAQVRAAVQAERQRCLDRLREIEIRVMGGSSFDHLRAAIESGEDPR